MIGIYKFENKYTHQIYIGQSIHIETRYEEHRRQAMSEKQQRINKFYDALFHHFEDFTFEIIEECDASQLNEREVFWIAYYDSFYNGLNSNKGGSGCIYDRQEIFNLWDKGLSVGEITQQINCAPETVRSFLQGYKTYSITESKKRGGQKTAPSNKIYQFSLSGELIAEFPSMKEAMRQTGIQNTAIAMVISGERAAAGGFKWSDSPELKNIKRPGCHHFKVGQYSLDGQEIAIYPNYQIAAQALGKSDFLPISKACGIKDKVAYGFLWKLIYK